MKTCDKVLDLKQAISLETGLNPQAQILIYNRELLEDSKTVAQYSLQQDARITLVLRKSGLLVSVKTQLFLCLEPSDTVNSLKAKLQSNPYTQPCLYDLKYQGQTLDDDLWLAGWGAGEGAVFDFQ